jgi:F-type H+-transporting ATPase subunit delta
MLTAGRETYAAAAEELGGYAADASAAQLTRTADEILAVADLLRREPRLRRAMIDASRASEDRAALLAAVLSGKVGDAALGLLTVLVRGRWATPGELLDGVERLGAETLLAAAGQAGELGDVEDELFRFGQIVAGNAGLASAMSDSTAALPRRVSLADDLLGGRAHPVTNRLVELALHGFGGRGFAGSLTRLVELAAARRDREVAYVISAVPLTEDEEQRLAARLSGRYGRQISLKVDVDPSVIGGVRVRVGADLYDGTVAHRLAQSRKALAG